MFSAQRALVKRPSTKAVFRMLVRRLGRVRHQPLATFCVLWHAAMAERSQSG